MAARKRPPRGMANLEQPRLPTLTGARVALRWLTAADADDIYAIYSDPEAMRFWSTTAMTAKSQARTLLREIREEHAAGQLHEWGLVTLQGGKVIGTCTLFNLDRSNRRAELGFALGRPWWGKGLMGEALTVLLDFSFGELGFRRIEADADPGNTASIRLLESLGFSREGLLRERWNVGGELQDTVFLGLLAREYRPRRN